MKTIIMNTAIAVTLMFAGQAGAVEAAAAKALAKNSGCLNCHAIDSLIVGPAWQDVGAKYANEKGAAERLVSIVTKRGSKGVWGENQMPAQTRVSEEDVRILVEYILTLHR